MEKLAEGGAHKAWNHNPHSQGFPPSHAHADLVMCRKQPGIAIGRLCEKVRPRTRGSWSNRRGFPFMHPSAQL